jgi:hypothetical protein
MKWVRIGVPWGQVGAECLPNLTVAREACRKLAAKLGGGAGAPAKQAYRSLEGTGPWGPRPWVGEAVREGKDRDGLRLDSCGEREGTSRNEKASFNGA